jgi:predicted Zn-dependent protease
VTLIALGVVVVAVWWRQTAVRDRTVARRQAAEASAELSRAEDLFHQRRPAEALPHALRAVELQPGSTANQMLLAEIYDDLKRTHEMIGPLRKALEIDPGLLAARLNLSYALIWTGDTVEGRREAAQCLERDPDSVPARRLLAQCDRDDGNAQSALENVRRGLAVAPDDFESRLLEAELLLFMKRGDEAYQRLESLPEGAKSKLRTLTLLARAAGITGRTEAATEYRRQIDRATRAE